MLSAASLFEQTAELTASDGGTAGSVSCGPVAVSGNTMVLGATGAAGGYGAYVFTKSGSAWIEAAKLTVSADTGSNCGQSIAISGNTVVIGVTGELGLYATTGGAAYVFTEPASGWENMTQTATLTPSDGAVNDGFGSSVSIDGSTIAVTEAVGFKGAYVFTEPASGWTNMTQTAKLTPTATQAGFPTEIDSVSISGNTIVVGAIAVGDPVEQEAFVFVKPASGWANMTQTATLAPSDVAVRNIFGSSVSISGNTVVVGSPQAGPIGGEPSGNGVAYVFTEPVSGWANATQTATLTASDGAANDGFGSSVTISGNTVVIAAPFATIGGNSDQGAAYVFTEPSSGWANMTQTAKLTASDGAANGEFGDWIAISGNTLAVGVMGGYNGNLVPGAVYVFDALSATTVTAVSSTQATGTYAAGTTIPIMVTFSGPVTVTGVPRLMLNDGATATYTGGSGTTTLTFKYTVAAGDSSPDLDYASTAALVLNGGSIEDVAGKAVTLILPATGTDGLARQKIVIDTPPTVTSAANKIAAAGQKYTYQIKTSASAHQKITFSLRTAPAGMSINASTGLVTWVPNISQMGSSTVTVLGTDQFGSTTQQTFSVSVYSAIPTWMWRRLTMFGPALQS